MKRTFFALAASLAAISLASAQTHKDTGGTILNGVNDLSNVTQAPTSCHVTVTTTATLLSTLMASGTGDGCTQPNGVTAAYVTALNSNLPAFCYSQESSLTSACLRGQEVPGWTAWPLPSIGLTSTYFVVPSGTATLIIEWRG